MARGKNEVTLTFAGDTDQLEKAFDRVGQSAKNMETDVGKSSKAVARDTSEAFDRAAEGADTVDTRAMGFRDTITGVMDTMRGWSDESLSLGDRLFTLGMGVGDLASGMANFLIPAMSKLPGIQRVVAAGQAAVNAVMNANPIALVVTGLAALAAAFVLAWKKSETFRNIVTGAFGFVTDAAAKFLNGIASVVGIFNDDWAESIRGAAARVEAWGDTSEDAGERVVKRFESTSEKARKLRRRMDDLSASADEFSGQARDLDSAMIALEESIDAAREAARKNGKQTDISTEKGRANRQSLIDLAAAHADTVESMKENGATQRELREHTRKTRKSFIEVAEKIGFTRDEAKDLADKYGLVPKNVRTRVSAPGLSSVSRRVARLDNALAGLPSSVRMEFKGVGDGPGRVGAGKAIARTRALAAGLPVSLSSAYRSPSHNARVGGSPTSYHMDASNPAGDWVGPTWALDALYRRLVAAGGFREILWRTTGHFDHLHAARKGGVMGGWTLVGEEGPELARLPVGTRVIPNAASRRMGGATTVINVIVHGSVLSERELMSLIAKRVRTDGAASLGLAAAG